MKFAAIISFSLLLLPMTAPAQSSAPRRSVMDHIFHPFGSSKRAPVYRDARLNGLLLEIQVPSEPVRLSETRQLNVKATLSNIGKGPASLDFPNAQRIDIQLLSADNQVLTRWSETRAFAEEVGHLLVNPYEQIVYDETIATRELQPGRVYTVDVFFPSYPELHARQKFMTAP